MILIQSLHLFWKIHQWYQVCNLFYSLSAVTKGKSHNLLRKKLLRDEKEQANRIEKEKNDELKAVDALQEEVNNLKEELKQRDYELEKIENDQKILHTLYKDGVIDEHGNLL